MKTFFRVLIAFLLTLALAGSAMAANWSSEPPHTHVTWNS